MRKPATRRAALLATAPAATLGLVASAEAQTSIKTGYAMSWVAP